MTYTRSLALALRARGASEDLVADVVREVEDMRLGEDCMEEELGTPEEYAEKFVPRPAKKRAGPVLTAGVMAAGLWLIIAFAGRTWGWNLREDLGPLFLLPALLALTAGILGQFLADYFRSVRD